MNGRWQGSLQVDLNDHGREQARSLAARLASRPIKAIFASDLSRAFETAEILGYAVGVMPQPEPRLQEMNLGIFQGLTRAEIIARYADEYAAMQADQFNYVIPTGESRRMLQNRAFEAFEEVTRNSEGPEIALVSHGVTIRMLMAKLFPHDERLNHMDIGNTSVTTLVRNEVGWDLEELVSISHLEQPATDALLDRGEAASLTQPS